MSHEEDSIAVSSNGRWPRPAQRGSAPGRMPKWKRDALQELGIIPGAGTLAAKPHLHPAADAYRRLQKINRRQLSEQGPKRSNECASQMSEIEASEDMVKFTTSETSIQSEGSEGLNNTMHDDHRQGSPTLQLDTPCTQEQRGLPCVPALSRPASRPRPPHFDGLRFDESVEIRDFSQGSLPELHGIAELLVDMREIAEGTNIVPSAVVENIESTETTDWVKGVDIMGEYHLSDEDALVELGSLRDIVFAAHECRSEDEPVSAWNILVHHRLLQLALVGSQANLQSISDATIIPVLNPRNIMTHDPFASPTVHFCMTVEPTLPQSDTIMRLLEGQPESLRSLNQTMHPALRFRPGLVPIQTTTGGRACESGTEGLALWCRTWLRRVRNLGVFNSRIGRIPTMPLIHTVGHDWYLLLAWEEEPPEPQFLVRLGLREPTLVILSELHIGDTRSVGGVYKIMAAVRRLGVWADGPFRKWFDGGIRGSSPLGKGTPATGGVWGTQKRPQRPAGAVRSGSGKAAGPGRLVLPEARGTGSSERSASPPSRERQHRIS